MTTLATRYGIRHISIDYAEENLKHELNVLLKRGVHGLYLFAVDEGLQQRLKECCIH